MNEDILQIYKNDLWKDKRLLDPKGDVFIKKSENLNEHETEISVINFLHEYGIQDIPTIVRTEDLNIYMPIYRGIRVFELLVQLDELYVRHNNSKAKNVKQKLICRCNKRQKNIQEALIEWRKYQPKREPYPQFKLNSIIQVLSECLQVKYDKQCLAKELEKLNSYWVSLVNVPFRDAVVKNMVFVNENLTRIELNPTVDKTLATRKRIEKLLDNDDVWENTSIADFDFSSCVHDTTFEDDFISLNFHERTFNGNSFIDPSELIWHGTPDKKRAAISFLVRYYRFGGRKAAYRLLNPINHIVRFANDNDCFYFQHLNTIVRNLWKEIDDDFPVLMKINSEFGKKLGSVTVYTDEFYARFPNAFREPWEGMYERPGK